MKASNKLLLEQIDKKLEKFSQLDKTIVPSKGWIHTIRTSINMSMRQMGAKLGITAQSVQEIEETEANGSITLKSIKEVARALDMKLVYGFIPKEYSIEKMIEKRALEVAREIVLRTSNTMKLEDQENSKTRIEKAIKEKATEIKNELPKYLWD